MSQYSTLDLELSNSQRNKLKYAIKNAAEATLNLSSNLIGNTSDESYFPHKLLLTDTQVSKIRKAFTHGSSANIKFSKTQLSKMIQSGWVVIRDYSWWLLFMLILENILSSVAKKGTGIARNLGNDFLDKQISSFNKKYITGKGSGITILTNNEIKDILKVIKSLENRRILLKETTRKITSHEGRFLNFLRSLMTAGLSLMKNVLTPLAKTVLLPFALKAGISAVNEAIQKKIPGSGTTALIILNEEIEDIMKIVKSLEELWLLIKGIIENN